jgi:hypothetical protein
VKTDCKEEEVADFDFGLVCLESDGLPVRHLFGKGSFDPVETFDTLIMCDKCLGLGNVQDRGELGAQVATMGTQVYDLKNMMATLVGDVKQLNLQVNQIKREEEESSSVNQAVEQDSTPYFSGASIVRKQHIHASRHGRLSAHPAQQPLLRRHRRSRQERPEEQRPQQRMALAVQKRRKRQPSLPQRKAEEEDDMQQPALAAAREDARQGAVMNVLKKTLAGQQEPQQPLAEALEQTAAQPPLALSEAEEEEDASGAEHADIVDMSGKTPSESSSDDTLGDTDSPVFQLTMDHHVQGGQEEQRDDTSHADDAGKLALDGADAGSDDVADNDLDHDSDNSGSEADDDVEDDESSEDPS